ncbi:MAG: RimK-like ATPgrasp N-terminal domain-containing protein [Candidatus Bathyarchaeota archaeon]|nr:RimK-like ATPgrasp N-terminal domain-containing protein [Candidatus Bathyarchaeota archaeon]
MAEMITTFQLSGVLWVLVVSDLDLSVGVRVMRPSKFLESTIKDFIFNVNSDYRYLKIGYYVSLYAEVMGNPVIPSSEDIIDANRIPILLLRAAKSGVPTIPFLVTDSVKKIALELGFPVTVFAVNPFIYSGYKKAHNKSALYRAVKSLSMNYKFAVCAQPLKGEMLSFKSIFGKCSEADDAEVRKILAKVYEVFKIPVCKLHIQKVEGKAYLCGFQPLKRIELSPNDVEQISQEVLLLSKQDDCVND